MGYNSKIKSVIASAAFLLFTCCLPITAMAGSNSELIRLAKTKRDALVKSAEKGLTPTEYARLTAFFQGQFIKKNSNWCDAFSLLGKGIKRTDKTFKIRNTSFYELLIVAAFDTSRPALSKCAGEKIFDDIPNFVITNHLDQIDRLSLFLVKNKEIPDHLVEVLSLSSEKSVKAKIKTKISKADLVKQARLGNTSAFRDLAVKLNSSSGYNDQIQAASDLMKTLNSQASSILAKQLGKNFTINAGGNHKSSILTILQHLAENSQTQIGTALEKEIYNLCESEDAIFFKNCKGGKAGFISRIEDWIKEEFHVSIEIDTNTTFKLFKPDPRPFK